MQFETPRNYSELSQSVNLAANNAAGIHALTEDSTEELVLRNWLDITIQEWEETSKKLWMGSTPTTASSTTVASTTPI